MKTQILYFGSIALTIVINVTSYKITTDLGKSKCVLQQTSHWVRVADAKSSLVHSVVCNITDINQLERLMEGKPNVTDLDLSHNHIRIIPEKSLSRYSHLVSLSLAYNDIRHLTYQAFSGLHRLMILNLTKNPFRSFTGNLLGLFSSLSLVDATGIENWTPEKGFLRLRMLKEIIGWGSGWRANMFCRCSLYRNNVTWSPDQAIVHQYRCFISTITVNSHSFAVNLLNNTEFAFNCSNDFYIDAKCKVEFGYSKYYADNPCWDEQLLALNCQSFLGGLAVLLNLVVFLTIITSKSLRNNVSMLFVCNMALSDFMLGVYLVCISIYLNSSPFRYLSINAKYNCLKVGFLWVLGQTSTVVTSFLLTLERYLVIVFSMKPEVRITRHMAAILVLISWSIAIFLTGFSLYHNLYHHSILCVPISFTEHEPLLFNFTASIASIAVVFYLITFIFYVQIYISVKRTAQNAGIKRESKLAKNIAIMVSSNVFFFVVPVLCGSVISILDSDIISDVFRELVSTMFTVLCMSLNLVLNPILYAFRTDTFTRVLKERFSGMQRHVRAILSACRVIYLRPRVHSEDS